MNHRTLVSMALVLALAVPTACSDPENHNGGQAANNDRDPEPYSDTGDDSDTESDTQQEPLGELCHVQLTVTTDVRAAAPEITASDLTTDEPLTILDRSSPGNHYFDALLGHEVEFSVVPGAGAPVAPLTYRAAVDQRCNAIGDLEFYTPIGLTIEPLDDVGGSVDDLPQPFVDVAAGLMLLRGQNAWHAVETTDNPRFNIAEVEAEAAFEQLPEDVHFTSLNQDYILAEATDEVMVLGVEPAGLPVLAPRSMPTPLQDVQQLGQAGALIHDADGGVWRLELGTGLARSAVWTRVIDEPQRSVSASSSTIWMVDAAGVLRRAGGDSQAVTTVGTIAGQPVRIAVNDSGLRLLAWFGPSCGMWTTTCGVGLYDTADAALISDADGAPVTVEGVVAATRIDVDFALVTQDAAGLQVRHIEGDRVVDGETLSSTLVAERSAVLPEALAVATNRRTTFVRGSSASPAFEEGWWTVSSRTDEYIGLVEYPCEDPIECERVLWFRDFRARATSPGTTLVLGRDLSITPLPGGDAYSNINFEREAQTALAARSITIDPLLVPMGAPCLPIVDTTVAVERFTSAAKALHCVTWWD